MVATGPRLAIVWDEGYTLGREARLRLWFRALADPARFAAHWHPPAEELVQQVGAPPPTRAQIDTRGKLLFDPKVVAWFWPFAREEPHGHPPFYALVGLVGDIVAPWLPALQRARLGPMLLFSLTAGALFAFVANRWGRWAGTVAAGAWIFQPNLFAHGHYATYDALLAALWLGAVLAFSRAVEDAPTPLTTGRQPDPARPRWGWLAVFGLLLGCAADTKLTGWFLPLPFLVWVGIYRSRRGMLTLLVGSLIALATLYVLNPPWWTEPLTGPVRFFASNLRRDETIRIKTLFLGTVVSTPDGSLPWYNTLAWTVLVTPLGVLLLALTGVARALRRWRSEPLGLLAVGHWAFLLVLRALPHTPGHDGVRQFLPAFGLLALVAGLGAATAVETLGRAGRVLSAVALGEAAIGLAVMWPVPLSYFSPLVGGLPGATALGMEPTYYWDALDDQTLAWLRAHTRPGQKIRFATYPTSWLYLRNEDRLPPGLLPGDPGVWAWYVVQNRPGAFSPLDRALVARGRPAWVVKKLGIPLLWVFPTEQVEAFLRSGQRSTAAGQDAGRRETPTTPPGRPGGSWVQAHGPRSTARRAHCPEGWTWGEGATCGAA
jgi:4-amino-4-deoxy-L-arabinose transferase-like glycosyltransferase